MLVTQKECRQYLLFELSLGVIPLALAAMLLYYQCSRLSIL